jgi:hypothetical protein
MGSERGSLYCWTILTIFIFSTVAFMVNFYYKTINEINMNAGLNDEETILKFE